MVFLVGLAAAFLLAWRGQHQHLEANPVEAITHATGNWTLRFLLVTLMITPCAGWQECPT